jgi:methionyl-tRNA formyltransferase
MADGPRVVFMGMLGEFSRMVCEGSLHHGANLVAVVVPGEKRDLEPLLRRAGATTGIPILTPYLERNLLHLAWEHGIPVFATSDAAARETRAALQELRPDVLAVACWPKLLPRSVRDVARLAVNVHPSLLPENRGPEPLFWTFRLGLRRTGVTVHVLEDAADAGAILAQRELPVPEGIDGAELELRLAQEGGELLARVIDDFAAHRLTPRSQDEQRASYQPAPSAEDWRVPAGWTVQQAANFRRGVAHLNGPQEPC